MIAGPLDRRIVWQRATWTRDTLGQPQPAWSTLFETWCAKVTRRPLVAVAEGTGETVKEATQIVQFRYRGAMIVPAANDRAEFEGKVWQVQGITEIGRREGWEITLRTREDAGPVTGA